MDKIIYEKEIWWLADYYNEELMKVEFALKRKNGYIPEMYRNRNIEKLAEYMCGKLKMTLQRDTPKEDVSIFWKKKKRLDFLIKELNKGFHKDEIDDVQLKKLFNEVCMIIFTTEAEYPSNHTPFPEVTT